MPSSVSEAAADCAREVLLTHLFAVVAQMKAERPRIWIDDQLDLLESVIADVGRDQGIKLVVSGNQTPAPPDLVVLIRHNLERLANQAAAFLGTPSPDDRAKATTGPIG